MTPYDGYLHLIRQLDDLIGVFEQHPDPATREQIGALLGGIDLLHREGLTRLVARLHELGGDAIVEQVARDPIVATLLGLYDLAALDLPPEQPVEPAARLAFIPLERVGARRSPGLAGTDSPRSAGPRAASPRPRASEDPDGPSDSRPRGGENQVGRRPPDRQRGLGS